MLCALKVSKIKSLIDCDLSARQSGLWFGAPKLKCGQINRKGNGSTEGMWNQISLTLWFLLTLAFDNVAPDNLHSRTNLSLFSFSSDSHPLAFLPFSVFSLSPSFSLPRSFQMGCLATKRERALPAVSVQRRRREEPPSGSRSGTRWWDRQQNHNTEVQIHNR